MVQVLKRDVRDRLLVAAEQIFAQHGLLGATMAMIAERAGISTGNIYRYFPDKESLFETVISDEFTTTFMRLVEQRVNSLARGMSNKGLGGQALQDQEELLQFWIKHRLKTVILLDRAQGSRHEKFTEQFIGLLKTLTLQSLQSQKQGWTISPEGEMVLHNIFASTVRMIVAILQAFAEESQIRKSFQGFWSYQLAGLAGFQQWAQQ